MFTHSLDITSGRLLQQAHSTGLTGVCTDQSTLLNTIQTSDGSVHVTLNTNVQNIVSPPSQECFVWISNFSCPQSDRSEIFQA